MFSTGNPIALCSRYVISPSSPAHSSTSLKCGRGAPAYNSRFPSALVTGGRTESFSVPSTRSLAGSRSFNPCWYWIPIVSHPNSSAIRTAATYVLHCIST